MANNYLQFSEIINLKSKVEVEWANSFIESFERDGVDDSIIKRYGMDIDDEGLCFNYEIDRSSMELWMYSEEAGNPDHVALFVQDYFRKFDKSGCFTMTWAHWCSRPRVGEFGGGAVVVTAEKLMWLDARDWAFNNSKSVG